MDRRERSRRKKKLRQKQLVVKGLICILLVAIFIVGVVSCSIKRHNDRIAKELANREAILDKKINDTRPDLVVNLLTVNEYSRPGTPIERVNGIVVHYTANPGTTAAQNRDYFEGLATSGETYASSHFVIGLEGEIVQCIPCNEIAYASNERNDDTISIECCIEDESGKFNQKTYDSLVELTTWLMGRYDLGTDDVIRHYDVTGKSCPKYFVDHEDKWKKFKEDLIDYVDQNGINL